MGKTKVLWIALSVILLAIIISIWTPWHRQPVVFYEPLILPREMIKGDIVVLENGSHIVIDEDKRINTIRHNNGSVTINATVHRNLWQLLTK